MNKLGVGAALAIALATAIGACGGKVVVDGAGNAAVGGAGGAGGDWGGGSSGALCFADPPDPSALSFCVGSTGAGGSDTQCENDWCDDQGNTWTALCKATTCQCMLNGFVECTCALNGAGNFCVGTPTCCPLPGLSK